MKYSGLSIACTVMLMASQPAVAAGWDAAAVGKDLLNGNTAQALAATQARLADHPDDPQARFLQARAEADAGKVAHAISGYEKLSRRYPQRARVWNNLGVLYARQGRLDKARAALARAVRAEPDYAAAHANLGDVYVALANEAYGRARQQGADPAAMKHRRRDLQRLVPSLPSAVGIRAGASAGKAADKSAAADIRRAIDQVLSRWAKAWSDQDLSAYLSVYSDDYQPHGDTTRAQWIRQQRVRVTRSKSAAVSISDVQVTPESADRARATFQEHYHRSGDDRDATRHMRFVREDGTWRIRRES